MPSVSGGGGSGAAFNGGTITTPEVIDVGALATAGGLTIQGTSGANVDRLLVNFLHTLFELTGDGVLNVRSDDTLAVEFRGLNNTGCSVLATGDNSNRVDTELDIGFGVSVISRGTTLGIIQSTNNNNVVKFAAGDSVSGGIVTNPPVSVSSTLALGTAYQNTLGYDVMLCVYLSVTVNTSGVLKLGVGPTATPTQQTIVTGLTATGLWPVPIYLPSGYYALLSVSGTITVAVDGQIAMPV